MNPYNKNVGSKMHR